MPLYIQRQLIGPFRYSTQACLFAFGICVSIYFSAPWSGPLRGVNCLPIKVPVVHFAETSPLTLCHLFLPNGRVKVVDLGGQVVQIIDDNRLPYLRTLGRA